MSVVEEVRSVNKLKVLRVVDAGLDTYPCIEDVESRKDGYVDFQYSGVVDLFVDLSTMSVTASPSNTYIITLKDVEMTDVHELKRTRIIPVDSVEKLSIEDYRKFYGSKDAQNRIYDNFSKIQAASVRKTAATEENVKRAREQAEKLLRHMFAPFVSDKNRDIAFKWGAETVGK